MARAKDIIRNVVGGLSRLISIVALIAIFVLSFLLIRSIMQTKETQQLTATLQTIRETAEQNDTDWSQGMSAVNPDYKGWLTVYGTTATGPVVQGETNDTYLRTDIYGEHSIPGTLFLDERCDTKQHGNLIIYGHKMNDGTMFGSLDKFKDEEFFNENGTVCWEGEYGKEYYQIFALMVIPGYTTDPKFIDIQEWCNNLSAAKTEEMLTTIEDRASIYKEMAFDYENDKFIFLVTCDYNINNGRMVLVGKRLKKIGSDNSSDDTTVHKEYYEITEGDADDSLPSVE